MQSVAVERHLKWLRADFAAESGEPFKHFFCPILLKDEATELCMGHIVNQAIPNCNRSRIVQRKDVDSFFGYVAEGEFGTFVQARKRGLQGLLAEPRLANVMQPKFVVDGEVYAHYHPTGDGQVPAEHSRIVLATDDGANTPFVIAKSPNEIEQSMNKRWTFVVEKDCRVSAFITLLKSAFLTLFRILGYRYAQGIAGRFIGHDLLGSFFLANHGKPRREVIAAAPAHFDQYTAMVRPITGVLGEAPKGTIEDRKVQVCVASSGRPFGIIVCVRTDDSLHAVLTPVFDDPESVATYLDFLRNDNETLHTSLATFDIKNRCWYGDMDAGAITWPKTECGFDS